MMTPDWDVVEARLDAWGLGSGILRPEVREALESGPAGRRVLVADQDPRAFVRAVFSAIKAGSHAVLANPRWGEDRWREAVRTVDPDLIVGRPRSLIRRQTSYPGDAMQGDPRIIIPTGGTGEGLRFAVHSWSTLSNACAGFYGFFGGVPVHTCCILPLFHVSGFLQLMRSLLFDGKFVLAHWEAVKAGAFPLDANDFPGAHISMVPSQLHQLIDNDDALDWLRRFRSILLGGGPASRNLVRAARGARLPLAPCYGLTETAALISILYPDEFLDGQDGVGRPLPHVNVWVREEVGLPAGEGRQGELIVNASSLCEGYFDGNPPTFDGSFATGDIGYIDHAGYLYVVGRRDHIINTGGEKVDPWEVEALLMEHPDITDCVVIGVPDPDWVERVVAVLVPSNANLDVGALVESVRRRMANYQVPKRWIVVDEIPRNRLGKVDRLRLALD